jgi:hypothetical protein
MPRTLKTSCDAPVLIRHDLRYETHPRSVIFGALPIRGCDQYPLTNVGVRRHDLTHITAHRASGTVGDLQRLYFLSSPNAFRPARHPMDDRWLDTAQV